MTEEGSSPDTSAEADFGESLARRLNTYRTGVLGRNPRVTGGSPAIARSEDFGGTLQSLLSRRQTVVATPPGELPTMHPGEAAAPQETGAPLEETPEADGPPPFGSPAFFAYMQSRMDAVIDRQTTRMPPGMTNEMIRAGIVEERGRRPAATLPPSNTVERISETAALEPSEMLPLAGTTGTVEPGAAANHNDPQSQVGNSGSGGAMPAPTGLPIRQTRRGRRSASTALPGDAPEPTAGLTPAAIPASNEDTASATATADAQVRTTAASGASVDLTRATAGRDPQAAAAEPAERRTVRVPSAQHGEPGTRPGAVRVQPLQRLAVTAPAASPQPEAATRVAASERENSPTPTSRAEEADSEPSLSVAAPADGTLTRLESAPFADAPARGAAEPMAPQAAVTRGSPPGNSQSEVVQPSGAPSVAPVTSNTTPVAEPPPTRGIGSAARPMPPKFIDDSPPAVSDESTDGGQGRGGQGPVESPADGGLATAEDEPQTVTEVQRAVVTADAVLPGDAGIEMPLPAEAGPAQHRANREVFPGESGAVTPASNPIVAPALPQAEAIPSRTVGGAPALPGVETGIPLPSADSPVADAAPGEPEATPTPVSTLADAGAASTAPAGAVVARRPADSAEAPLERRATAEPATPAAPSSLEFVLAPRSQEATRTTAEIPGDADTTIGIKAFTDATSDSMAATAGPHEEEPQSEPGPTATDNPPGIAAAPGGARDDNLGTSRRAVADQAGDEGAAGPGSHASSEALPVPRAGPAVTHDEGPETAGRATTVGRHLTSVEPPARGMFEAVDVVQFVSGEHTDEGRTRDTAIADGPSTGDKGPDMGGESTVISADGQVLRTGPAALQRAITEVAAGDILPTPSPASSSTKDSAAQGGRERSSADEPGDAQPHQSPVMPAPVGNLLTPGVEPSEAPPESPGGAAEPVLARETDRDVERRTTIAPTPPARISPNPAPTTGSAPSMTTGGRADTGFAESDATHSGEPSSLANEASGRGSSDGGETVQRTATAGWDAAAPAAPGATAHLPGPPALQEAPVPPPEGAVGSPPAPFNTAALPPSPELDGPPETGRSAAAPVQLRPAVTGSEPGSQPLRRTVAASAPSESHPVTPTPQPTLATTEASMIHSALSEGTGAAHHGVPAGVEPRLSMPPARAARRVLPVSASEVERAAETGTQADQGNNWQTVTPQIRFRHEPVRMDPSSAESGPGGISLQQPGPQGRGSEAGEATSIQRVAAAVRPPDPPRTVAPAQPGQEGLMRPIPTAMPPAPQRVQRLPERTESTGTVSSAPKTPEEPEKLNYDDIAEAVWPRIRRKIRLERERERGLPS